MIENTEDSRFPVLVARVSAVRLARVVERVLGMVGSHERGYMNVCTVHTILECVDDPVMAAIVNASTMAVPDGMPLVWLGRRMFPDADVQRCYGPDLMLAVCEAGLAMGLRHCLYGGAPDVLDENLKAKCPELMLVERISPPFRELTIEKKQQMADRINVYIENADGVLLFCCISGWY